MLVVKCKGMWGSTQTHADDIFQRKPRTQSKDGSGDKNLRKVTNIWRLGRIYKVKNLINSTHKSNGRKIHKKRWYSNEETMLAIYHLTILNRQRRRKCLNIRKVERWWEWKENMINIGATIQARNWMRHTTKSNTAKVQMENKYEVSISERSRTGRTSTWK